MYQFFGGTGEAYTLEEMRPRTHAVDASTLLLQETD